MTDVKIHVGDAASPAAMGERFVRAWTEAAAGGRVDERHLSFGSLQEAAGVLTPRRIELLRALHAEPAPSVRSLAARLGRDYRNVHADVAALLDHGLVDRDDAGALRADYDGISVGLAVAL